MIFLIRHADAVSDEVDPARPLSAKGREQMRRDCDVLRKDERFRPAEFWHSSLVRSRQTAELLAEGLGLSAPLVYTPGLEPENDPRDIAGVLASESRTVAVVGHEPHLGILSTLLAYGPKPGGVFFPFPKAGVLAFEPKGKLWRPEWIVRNP